MSSYVDRRVGDFISVHSEPPVGSVLECRDEAGKFRLHRDDRGWFMAGNLRRFPWDIVVRLWLPAEVVKLGSLSPQRTLCKHCGVVIKYWPALRASDPWSWISISDAYGGKCSSSGGHEPID